MLNKWYKIAQGSQEYIGPGEPVSPNVQQPFISRLEDKDGGNSDQAYRDPSGDGRSSPYSEPKRSCKDMHTGKILIEGERCPKCREKMMKNEFEEKSDGTYQYVCIHTIKGKKCGYSSYDSGWNIQVKRKSRIKHRRSSNISPFITATMPVTPYNNIANRPYGNLEISEDVRVIPYSKIDPDYNETWDNQKQKKKLDYKIKKIKDKEGKIRFIKVKDPSLGAGIQPSNTYTQKGDLRKQDRYRNDYDKNKNSQGTWPHNRSVGPENGWYGSDTITDKNRFNADMRSRFQTWDDLVRERGSQWSMFTKPL